MSTLSLEGVGFKYRSAKEPVLKDLCLKLEAGEAVMVSGPSGGGKTTLCLVASAIIPGRIEGDFSGSAMLMGEPTSKLGPQGASTHVGFVMQEPEYSMIMPSVEEEIAFGLENRSWTPEMITNRLEWIMGEMGLRQLSGRSPNRLSGGEKQAVAIAAAIAHHPALIILDEAFSGLDDGRRAIAGNQMAAMKRKGAAILLIEHEGTGRNSHPWVDRALILEGGALREAAS